MDEKEKKKLLYLRNYCVTILNYIEIIAADINSDKVMKLFFNSINSAYNRTDLKGMNKMTSEISEWGRSLSNNQVGELNRILDEKYGQDLFSDKKVKNIQSIIARGKINNLSEYQLLKNYLNDNFSDIERKQEMDKINLLIDEYQARTGNL